MAAMTNVLLKDDTVTTAVEFTLEPVSDNPVATWRANAASTPLEGQVRLSMESLKLKSGGYKLTCKLEVPVMETLGASGTSAGYVAPPKVAYVTTCIFTMFADRRSTAQDRMNALRMAVGVLQGATATTNTGTLAQSSAANAFSASAAFGPVFFKSAAQPN